MQDFSINYLSANNFAVYPTSITGAQIGFQFDFSSPVWSKIKVNFWASNNPQIQLGYFRVGITLLMQTTSRPLAPATAPWPMPTSTLPSDNQTTPSSESLSTVSTSRQTLFKFLSAPSTFKEPSLPSRSQSVQPLLLEKSGYLGWPSPQPLLPSVHMEVKSPKVNIRVQ